MPPEIIDEATDLELVRDGETFTVRFPGDTGGGSSLLFAYLEHEIYFTDACCEVPLDKWQIEQVCEWFKYHEEWKYE